MNTSTPKPTSQSVPVLRVTVGSTPEDRRVLRFQKSIRIGRADDCEVCIKSQSISRYHAEALFHQGQWWIRDLKSTNGIVVADQQVGAAPVGQGLTVRLGFEGPFVGFKVEPVAPPARPSGPSDSHIAHYEKHYFGEAADDEPIGERTMLIRQAFKRVHTQQKRKYGWIIGALAVLVLGVGVFALYQYRQASQQKELAQGIFYAMKALDVDIASLEKLVTESNSASGMEELRKYQTRRKDMEEQYDRFLSTLQVYDPRMTEEDRLVLRVARIFGECELAMPAGFAAEVKRYIKKWQSSERYARGIKTANDRGYTTKIVDELLARDLPPQFFYLALQESDFDPFISGPPTRYGIAKGMWQFIPETGVKYGLRIGPLVALRRPDPSDDRDRWELATKAAARYLKDLYATDAQGSGLLAMASYNWGENRVTRLILSMPANPKQRNFWRLLSQYRDQIPQETYDYVFYIFSAAVVGENPRLFGFNFDNPLAHLESK